MTKVTQTQHEEILNFLRDVPSNTCVLLTTTSAISFGEHISLEPLSTADSLVLIRSRARQLACSSISKMCDSELKPLCVASGGSPVALRLAVGLALTTPIDDIVTRLRSGKDRFSVLCADAYALLSEQARDILDLICISQVSISVEALEHFFPSLRDTLGESGQNPLMQLEDMGLIVGQLGDTWKSTRFCPSSSLVREYYSTATSKEQPEKDYHLRASAAAYYYRRVRQKGPYNFAEYDWMERNLSEIYATLDWCEKTKQRRALIRMMEAIYYFMGVRGYWKKRIEYGNLTVQAARSIGDRRGEAQMLVRVIGWTKTQLREYAEAETSMRRGLEIFEGIGDHGGMSSGYRYLGTIYRRRGQFDEAESYYQQSLSHAELASDDEYLKASAMVSMSTLYLRTGRLDESESRLKDAEGIFTRLENKSRIAEVLSRLGDVKLAQGQTCEAQSYYEQSEVYTQEIKSQKTRGYNLLGFAHVALARGDPQSARVYAEQARSEFGNLGIAGEVDELLSIRELTEQ